MQIKKIGEFGLLNRLQQRTKISDPSIVQGIGDDCAVINFGNGRFLLATCDVLLEGVHFNLRYTDSNHLGKKALAVNLSDIAAMGGAPRFYLASLGLPPHLRLSWVDNLYKGMETTAKENGVSLIGGNISSSRTIFIDLTVLGEITPQEIVYRHGARTGDAIFVTGTLGDSALGLMALRSRKKIKNTSALRRLTEKHLSPSPRIREGRFIAANRIATAMIDISDGLIADLRHILKNSNRGAEIWVDAIPFSSEVIRYSPLYRMNPTDLALAGGEDYELLFTVPRKKLKQLQRLSQEFSLSVTMIGKITGERGKIRLRKSGGELYRIQKEGFRHF